MNSAWHEFRAHGDDEARAAIVEALARAGLRTRDTGDDLPTGPGLVFFDEITPPLCRFLWEVSRHGFQRVLAIGISPRALAGGGAWRLLEAGASDVFSWDHSKRPAEAVVARLERWEAVDQLVHSPLVESELVGKSTTWTSRLRQIVEVARFTDASILITGETGTGKELVARAIHSLDPRPNKGEFIILDCTTVVPELSGSEFFGHERGAFTGAVTARDGAFSLADGGTLFLDEIAELPLPLQAELLRVIQERTYKRVGSNTWRRTSFRLVCASNRDLLGQAARGSFRRDLYYRIAGWTCTLPPLRHRVEDILPLARHFMRQVRPGGEPSELDEPVTAYLLKRDYPGNVRDLKQLISRIMFRHVGDGAITAGDIPEEERPSGDGDGPDWRDAAFEGAIHRALSQGVALRAIGQEVADTAIRLALGDEEGNLHRAARRLGVTDRALQMRRAARRLQDAARSTNPTY